MNNQFLTLFISQVKGVVSGDGRITCPWHGACFKIPTGGIESSH
jgi:nitrite reductase/ring-hydroxylating ferredoxin subunit